MAYPLGWRDILRPIRDGYRHLFPSPDTGPPPEERERQRQLDRLKGFTYFDTINQLENWTREQADPLQRANTPLLRRRTHVYEESDEKTRVLLIHDHSGNYHDYEAIQGAGIEEEEEDYVCEYLQFVDTFVYFSHKLVCIPPPSWTNLLHRNGVQAIGTLLVESQTKDAESLLHCEDRGGTNSPTYPMAKMLADIAQEYGFDGWLINIEKPFAGKSWNSNALEEFLQQLKDALGPDRTLIWFVYAPSLTHSMQTRFRV
jgi:endo-beta-N-acetylglucosaminidase D